MPKVTSRISSFDDMAGRYEPMSTTVSSVGAVPTHLLPVTDNVAPINTPVTSSHLMSITSGNSVPMRGVLPVEQMSDADVDRYFPYGAHQDRIPKYTYYLLFNTKTI